VRPPERDAPHDYRRAIDEVVAHLEGTARMHALRAAESAHRLIAELGRCDGELRSLSLGSGVAESDRIAAQLAALDGAEHASEEARELAALLRAQLGIVQRMRVRCEMLSARRGHLLHLLHGLWTRLAALGGLARETEAEELGRLDAVRDEIESELVALRAAMAGGGGDDRGLTRI
jgi:hypothetical protein